MDHENTPWQESHKHVVRELCLVGFVFFRMYGSLPNYLFYQTSGVPITLPGFILIIITRSVQSLH